MAAVGRVTSTRAAGADSAARGRADGRADGRKAWRGFSRATGSQPGAESRPVLAGPACRSLNQSPPIFSGKPNAGATFLLIRGRYYLLSLGLTRLLIHVIFHQEFPTIKKIIEIGTN